MEHTADWGLEVWAPDLPALMEEMQGRRQGVERDDFSVFATLEPAREVGGDLSDNHAALRESLSTMTLEAPYGDVTLDDNRQGIVDTFVAQLVLNDAGEVVQETKYIVPAVDQTFGGTYSSDTAPPERDNTPCEQKDLPWQGNEIPVVDGVPQG